MLERIEKELRLLDSTAMRRRLPRVKAKGRFAQSRSGEILLDLSSNDYLCIASDEALRKKFFSFNTPASFSCSASRLMGAANEQTLRVEQLLAYLYGKAALTFNSDYQINCSIIPALATNKGLILSDSFVNASLADGIRYSNTKSLRFNHNNLDQLAFLLDRFHSDYNEIIVVTESTFFMEGDICDLARLVELKHRYDNVILYVDTSHDVGVCGQRGLGEVERQGVISDIDFIVASFGNGLASSGAYLICEPILKDYLVNKARGFIYSTALSPLQMQWTKFVLENFNLWEQRRRALSEKSAYFHRCLAEKGIKTPSNSHIVPIICPSAEEAIRKAATLRVQGFHCLVARPPSVPRYSCRLRLSLNSAIQYEEMDTLIDLL